MPTGTGRPVTPLAPVDPVEPAIIVGPLAVSVQAVAGVLLPVAPACLSFTRVSVGMIAVLVIVQLAEPPLAMVTVWAPLLPPMVPPVQFQVPGV